MRLKIVPTAYFFLRVLFALGALGFLTMMQYSSLSVWTVIVVLGVYAIVVKRLDYLDPFVAFLIPWILILSFSLVPLSYYAKIIHPETYRLTFLAIFSSVIVAGGTGRGPQKKSKARKRPKGLMLSARTCLYVLEGLFLALTLLNILLAGYIPLVQGLETGNTGYINFGVHGLYGFYLAFANALGLFYIFIYLTTKKRSYLVRYCLILFIFILFVTRQNVLSITIESLAVFSLVKGRIKWRSMAMFLGILGVFFSIVGSFRSGNIKEIAGIDDKYQWIPEPLIWVYSYSYFNLANVDKLITTSGAPFYDGSSIAGIVPSFVRPTYDTEQYLEVATFNVSSYLYPLYQDVGVWGVLILTMGMLSVSRKRFMEAQTSKEFSSIASYAVLYFCALFSFFVNFWFYLPVIFQLVFLPGLSRLADGIRSSDKPVYLLPSPTRTINGAEKLQL